MRFGLCCTFGILLDGFEDALFKAGEDMQAEGKGAT